MLMCVCCGITQGPGERINCQEENSFPSDCQGQIQETAQIYLAHLTGVIWNYFEIQRRVMSFVAGA